MNSASGFTLGGGAGNAGTAAPGSSIIRRDVESIYEDLADVDYDVYLSNLEDLIDMSYVLRETDDVEDCTRFRARDGLTWADVSVIDCPIKTQILLLLIENPTTFFVLYNTQKGKLRIASEEIRGWSSAPGKKVVAFIIVDNDKTLADHIADGVFKVVEELGEVFTLSSNSPVTVQNIKDRIDSYAHYRSKMPVIVALNNAKQMKKVVAIMKHIQERMEQCPQLRYGVVFDEADKVYPPNRELFLDLIVNDNRALHRLGFVTATEGDLMDVDYPECANAYMYPVPPGDPNYRAIHSADVFIQLVAHPVKDNHDTYAENILQSNRDYFKNTIPLKDGSRGYRKVIVNGCGKTASMAGFARRRVDQGAYAITFNMMGVVVYRPNCETKRYSAKGQNFGKLLFTIYKELGLHDKPLFIIGRRKVDRGVGFHWAPRDGSEGLIWTDMILGSADNKDKATQKAGRLAGIVVHCPQYPGQLTWWTDAKTANMVVGHNSIVDEANTKRGCSALRAISHARDTVVLEDLVQPRLPTYKISLQTFDSVEAAKLWWKDPASIVLEPHDIRLNISQFRRYSTEEGECIKYRGTLRPLLKEAEVRAGRHEVGAHITNDTPARIMPVLDIQWGIASSARIMPVETPVHMVKYIVIYKPDAVYSPRHASSETHSEDSN